MRPRELPVALLVLRAGLGAFLLLWSIDKMVAPEQTAKIFQFFYRTPLPASFAPGVGVLEAALIPALAGFVALFLLRREDTLLTLGGPGVTRTTASA